MSISPQYIAGFIDGEGYLGLYAYSVNKSSYVSAVKVAQVAVGLPVLQALQSQYGGHIGFRKSKKDNHQDSYAWELKSKKGINKLLDDTLPYLIVKREQAVLLKEYCELPNRHPLYATPQTMSRGIEIATELLRLKRPLATTEWKNMGNREATVWTMHIIVHRPKA